MTDIEKKINLNVVSNLKSHLDTFEVLNKTIAKQEKLLKIAEQTGNKMFSVYQHNLNNLKVLQDKYRKSLSDTNIEAAQFAKQMKNWDKLSHGFDSWISNLKTIFSGNILSGFSESLKTELEAGIKTVTENKNKIIDARIFSIKSDINEREEKLAEEKEHFSLLKERRQNRISKLQSAIALEKDPNTKQELQEKLLKTKASVRELNRKDERKLDKLSKAAAQENLADETDIKNLQELQNQNIGKAAMSAKVMSTAISAVTTTLKFFGDAIKTTTGVTLSLKENLNDVLGTVGGIMNLRSGAATYSIGTSLISNASAREKSLQYGLGASQTYALQQTMDALGMKSDEDLMYMNAAQREKFSTFMDKYSSWYDEMQASGVLDNIQEMQLDLYMFKQELAMDFMNWFAEHKDTLLSAIKGIANFVMKLVEGVLWIVEGIATLLSWIGIKSNDNISTSMSASSGYSDAGNSYNSNSRINNVNINMTNNATGVLSNQAAMQQFYQEQMANMSKQLVAEIE